MAVSVLQPSAFVAAIEASSPQYHMDADATAHLVKELEHLKSKLVEVQYDALRAFEFFPLAEGTPPGAETVTYRMWDEVGVARILANGAYDIPRVDAFATEFPAPVYTVGAYWATSVVDMHRAAMSGAPIDTRRAMALRRAIDRAIDEILAFGVAGTATYGGINNPNVPVVVLSNGSWATATADQLVADLQQMEQTVIDQSNDVHHPNLLVLPPDKYGIIATKQMPGTSVTVLAYFLANAQHVVEVKKWNRLKSVDGVQRALCYEMGPDTAESEVPLLFESLAPQPFGLELRNPGYARVGTVIVYLPMAMVYAEGM